ncbi:MAG: hypothetical protein ACQET3_07170 [Promethearchaeati archaeon]
MAAIMLFTTGLIFSGLYLADERWRMTEVHLGTFEHIARTGGYVSPSVDGIHYPLAHLPSEPGNTSIPEAVGFETFRVFFQFAYGFDYMNGTSIDPSNPYPHRKSSEYNITVRFGFFLEVTNGTSREEVATVVPMVTSINSKTPSHNIVSDGFYIRYDSVTDLLSVDFYQVQELDEAAQPRSLSVGVKDDATVRILGFMSIRYKNQFNDTQIGKLEGELGQWFVQSGSESNHSDHSINGSLTCYWGYEEIQTLIQRLPTVELVPLIVGTSITVVIWSKDSEIR